MFSWQFCNIFSYSSDIHHQAACCAVLGPGARVEHPPTTGQSYDVDDDDHADDDNHDDYHDDDDDDHDDHDGDVNDDVYEGNLEVLAACLQLFALDNDGVDTSGLKARWNNHSEDWAYDEDYFDHDDRYVHDDSDDHYD